MKYRVFSYLAFCALLFGVTTQVANAQLVSDKGTDRRGTSGAQYLLIPLTARSASLGNSTTSGLANMPGLEAMNANPANLVSNQGTNALFSYVSYLAGININTFGIAQKVGVNQIALSVTSYDYGEIPLTTEESPEVQQGLTYDAGSVAVGLTYARQFTDRIDAGVTAKVVTESIDNLTSSGIALDAGMTYVVGESGLRFGVSLKNFGPQQQFSGDGLNRTVRIPGQGDNASEVPLQIQAATFELPSQLNVGASYTAQMGASASATLLGNFRSNALEDDQFTGALELGFQNILFVRGGYEYQNNIDVSTAFKGWSVGAGLNLDLSGTVLVVDYGFRSVEFFDNVNMITASITL